MTMNKAVKTHEFETSWKRSSTWASRVSCLKCCWAATPICNTS